MSDARAIEAVTHTLIRLVADGVNGRGDGFDGRARVDAKPPHEVPGTDELMVNLFLYQTEVDGSLRNEDALDRVPGETGDPPLPLVLRYLMTPYVRDGKDRDAHRLLGLAVRALHEHTVLGRAELASNAPFSDVARQLDRIRITWQPLAEADIYSLWSAFQTPYRLSTAFEVRAVLIDSRRPPRTPVPVLKRGQHDEGPVARGDVESPFPELTAAVPVTVDDEGAEHEQASAVVGGRVVLRGVNLGARTVRVLLSHPLLAEPRSITPAEGDATGTEVRFTLPAASAGEYAAGLWSVGLALTTGTGAEEATTYTNEVPLALAPKITSELPLRVARVGGTATFQVTCSPAVLAGQPVLFLLNGRALREVRAVANEPVSGGTLRFVLPKAQPGDYLIRLRVGGVDSPLVDRSRAKPRFDPEQLAKVE
ncbi:DUF4255 domain-containing protein [Amycolatopsis anabasis]|uniref:DUF4255 domain-containing protein n=1 Tax=Amycolatopsis anabasis TaxID=1840409 RepID=UPI00131B4A75|nr:DUF4255 domain-containing protein [Amycolatopsis anabasis]